MRLLLDTQIVVWSLIDARNLPQRARDLMRDPAHDQVVSAISVWEIAIKHARHGAAGMPLSGRRARELLDRGRMNVLSVTGEHAAAVDDLPALHKDPFDRMLVAQA